MKKHIRTAEDIVIISLVLGFVHKKTRGQVIFLKVPKIQKLPSGAYFCRIRRGGVDYTILDYDRDAVYAEAVAYKKGIIKAQRQPERITVKAALERYINERSNLLSPATLREYTRCANTDLAPLHRLIVEAAIHGRTLQRFVNEYAVDHKPKTVRNTYGLLASALANAGVDMSGVKVTLPEVRRPRLRTPTEADIRRLIAAVRGTELETPVLLAAFGSLRRSEICALTRDDVTDAGVWVTKALVQDKNKQWVIKQTKERSSDRHAMLPPEVVAKLKQTPPGERITQLSPNAVSHRFDHVVKKLGVPPFRFHDLRSYWATVAHAMGMPDYYIMQNGGWSTMETPRKHYLRNADELTTPAQNAANKYFSGILSSSEEE